VIKAGFNTSLLREGTPVKITAQKKTRQDEALRVIISE